MTDKTSRNGAGCLTLVTGRSGSGKTAHILTQICRKADLGASNLILLVPDQYSHEAERLLCSAGGDGISLHAEVLTFNRLFSRAAAACGGVADRYIDGAGKVLVMRRALNLAAELTEAYAGEPDGSGPVPAGDGDGMPERAHTPRRSAPAVGGDGREPPDETEGHGHGPGDLPGPSGAGSPGSGRETGQALCPAG